MLRLLFPSQNQAEAIYSLSPDLWVELCCCMIIFLLETAGAGVAAAGAKFLMGPILHLILIDSFLHSL